MRVSMWVSLVLAVGSACTPTSEEQPTVPAGATWLKFPDLNEALCGAEKIGCGGASRPLLATVTGAEFSDDGRQLALDAEFWVLTLACNIDGCVRVWEPKAQSLCYTLDANGATPSTGCVHAPSLSAPGTLPQAGPLDGFPFDHSQRRALLGMGNVDANLRLGRGIALGEHWLGDLDVVLMSPNAWDLGFVGDQLTRTFTALVKAGAVELLVPTPDAVPLSNGLITSAAGLYWANQADDVFALTVTDTLALQRRLVRRAITSPQTLTVGVRELGNEVISAVVTSSSTTLEGGGGPVYELSVVRTPKRADQPEPLSRFMPFAAHAPTSQSVVACFTQPLDEGSLAASQFSLAGVEVKAAVFSGVPQCARLSTGTLPRNATLVLTVEGVKARGGDVVRGARVSVTAPDLPQVPGVLRLTLPAGTKGFVPLDDDTLLISNGPDSASVDLAGVVVQPGSSGVAPVSGGFSAVLAEEGVLWSAYTVVNGKLVVRRQTRAGAVDLGGDDLTSLVALANDGTLLVGGISGQLVRVGVNERTPLPRVPNATFRGVLGAGRVLVEDTGRLQVVSLPDTLEANSFALPTGASGFGPAFESDGQVYWCTNGRLFRLGDSSSTDVAPCNALARDARGVLWVSQGARLLRVFGLDVRVVEAPPGTRPFFGGGFVWVDSLRIEEAVWRSLSGEL